MNTMNLIVIQSKFLSRTFSAALVAGMVTLLGGASMAQAAYVTPKMGGGQQSASMVMPNVLITDEGLSITGVLDMMGMPIMSVPVLRPLTGTDEFNPSAVYSVLSGKAYNLQYGWNLDAGSADLPSGGNIWIELLSSTPGISTYEHGSYTPIFGTAGSSDAWLWDGVMAHNAYAVDPQIANWSATYRLYIGDINGQVIGGYDDAQITLNWTSVPEPASMLGLVGAGAMMMLRRRGVVASH